MSLTHRERLKATAEHQPTDRPPVSAWGHEYIVEWYPSRLAQFTAANAQQYDWDWVKPQTRASAFAESLGVSYSPSPDAGANPVYFGGGLRAKADFERMADELDPTVLPDVLRQQVDVIAELRSTLDAETPIMQTVMTPLSVLSFAAPLDQAAVVGCLRDDPALFERLIGVIARRLGVFASAAIAAGAEGIYFAMTPEEYRFADLRSAFESTVTDADRIVLEQASDGWLNTLHMCGTVRDFDYTNRLPVAIVSWDNTDPRNPGLRTASELTTRALMGGVNRRTPISNGSAWELYREVLSLAEKDRVDTGWLLSPGCSVSPWPRQAGQNFHALRTAAEMMARLPADKD